MRDGALSINFYFCNLMTDERQRGSHEIVQSRGNDVKANYGVVLDAVKQNPLALQYASDDLKNNPNLVHEAVKVA